MNAAGNNISSHITIISGSCFRCGRDTHNYTDCSESTNKNGKKLGYCVCLKCR